MKEVKEQEFLIVTPEELKNKFPNLSKEDIDFYNGPKMLQTVSENIGVRKYNSLKQKQKDFINYNFANPNQKQKELTEIELKLIEKFESEKITRTESHEQNRVEHMKMVRNGKRPEFETIPGIKPNVSNLYHGFLQAFKALNGKDFELTEDSILNIKAVVKFFACDKTFFECERLIKEINGRELIPSFQKGILLVGDYGNGKSSIMQAFEYLINHNYKIAIEKQWDNFLDWKNLRFKFKSCRNISSEYEFLSKDDSKKEFINKYKVLDYCFDDITKEQIASNYGLKNVIQIILENRYDDIFERIKLEKRINRTFGTLNYHKDHPGNLKNAIQALGLKYEAHMYDRALELFNIIEFKGKSFRK